MRYFVNSLVTCIFIATFIQLINLANYNHEFFRKQQVNIEVI